MPDDDLTYRARARAQLEDSCLWRVHIFSVAEQSDIEILHVYTNQTIVEKCSTLEGRVN